MKNWGTAKPGQLETGKPARYIPGLVIVLLFSLVFKLVVLLLSDQALFFSHDTVSYVNSAWALLQTGSFSISPENTAPQTIRTPGYPVFLALIYGLAGENQIAVLLVQILFSVGTIALVYWLGCRLWNSKIGFIASIFLALDMNSAGFSLILLTETLFTFFMSAFVVAAMILLDLGAPSAENRKKYLITAFLGGLSLTVATHVRPISYYLIFLLLIAWVVWGLIKKWDRRALFEGLLAFFLPILILVGGWQVRNYLQTGSPQFSAIESINMINYRAAMIISSRDGISRDEAIRKISLEYGLNQEPGWNETWRSVGAKIILENPVLFAGQYAQGLVNIFIGPGSEIIANLLGMKIETSSPLGDLVRLAPGQYIARWIAPSQLYFGAFVFSMLHMLLMYLGVLVWIVMSFSRKQVTIGQVLLVALVFYFSLVSAGPEAYYRFRVPITPLLVLLAAAPLTQVFLEKPGVVKPNG